MMITSVKKLAESPDLKSIPSSYAYYDNPTETTATDPGDHDSIPIVDLSLLTSDDPDQRSKAIQDLDKACREWGFFMLVNHGIPENLMRDMIEVSREFFNLEDEEKPEFEPKNVLEPIRYGTSFNSAKETVFCWRDFLKVFVHPQFHCPDKPQSLREVLGEYTERVRNVVRKLVIGVSENLGIEECEMEKAFDLGSSFQVFAANYYPPCPNPDIALGLPPHSDHGLFSIVIQNEVGGLQIHHKGKYVSVDAPPNSILVNTADHIEIFSNGKYKSLLHRAVVNNERTRISIVVTNGPSPETVIRPASQLVHPQGCMPAAYVPMKYIDYLLLQQSNKLDGKSVLEQIKIHDP